MIVKAKEWKREEEEEEIGVEEEEGEVEEEEGEDDEPGQGTWYDSTFTSLKHKHVSTPSII